MEKQTVEDNINNNDLAHMHTGKIDNQIKPTCSSTTISNQIKNLAQYTFEQKLCH
jgi:hypothetical protein